MRRSFFLALASFFVLCCIIFIPFPFFLLKIQGSITHFIFGKLIASVSSTVFNKSLSTTAIYSDATSMYILMLLLFVLATGLSVFLYRTTWWERRSEQFLSWVFRIAVYYLAILLLKYGVDKIFKNQFYQPEPNTLYTPIGKLSKDILYWSTMGTSHFYSVFLGILETIAGVFLLIRRTRLTGLLMSFMIMLNVVAVNFAFDIGAKLIALFLLFISIYLLVPYFRKIYQFLSGQINYAVVSYDQMPLLQAGFIKGFIKWGLVTCIFIEVLFPYVRKKNLNDDLAARPYLHGAYKVTGWDRGGATISEGNWLFRKIFIHRHGYIIFQGADDTMQDYSFSPGVSDTTRYYMTNYEGKKSALHITYNKRDSVLRIALLRDSPATIITAKAMDWRNLPALKRGFHWTVD